jgi:transposase
MADVGVRTDEPLLIVMHRMVQLAGRLDLSVLDQAKQCVTPRSQVFCRGKHFFPPKGRTFAGHSIHRDAIPRHRDQRLPKSGGRQDQKRITNLHSRRIRSGRQFGDLQVMSGTVFINLNGLRWCDAQREYGPAKSLCNRWKRWGVMGVFARMMEGLASESAEQKTIMIAATYLKAHRTASGLRAEKGGPTTSAGIGSDARKVGCTPSCMPSPTPRRGP